ncbi:MAG: helix-turn-helix transcriptional regulator [Clostridiales bacterium]|nr:helix-turn-helix transcriptional regulator [Clostridiales bacterium]
MATLSERLKFIRNESGLLQKDIAKKLNITPSAYGFYEQGKRIPDSNTLNDIAKIFNVSLDYLMGVSDIKTSVQVKSSSLSKKEKADIAKDLDEIKQQLLDSDELMFDGMPMDEESITKILSALEVGMEMVRKKNKEKYTPKKYKR